MELHTVIDNLPDTPAALAHEHGLSFHFSLDGKNYLIDTGASRAFMGNMEKMGICSAGDIDAVFISHGHNDHTGGLRKFLECNSTAPVYLHNSIRGNYFYSCRPKNGISEARNIGMEQALFADYANRFREISEPARITDKITLIPVSATAGYPTPMGNEFLYCNDYPDKFIHEIAVLAEYAPGEFAVISPCSHNGILNILDVCSQWIGEQWESRIRHFIGGLHYVDYLQMGRGEKEAASILETARILKEKYPYLKITSGHCTCPTASKLLQHALEKNYEVFHTGSVIYCP